MLDQCYRKKFPAHYKQLLNQMNIQRCYGDFCDVTVVIQRMRFRAHRCVLSAASKKLHSLVAMMKPSSNSSRKHGCLSEELRIHEVSPQGFKIVLEYIYTGVLWIPGDCLNDVSTTATYLEMEDVIQCCIDFTLPQQSGTTGHSGKNMKDSGMMSPSSASDVGEDSQDAENVCVNDSVSNLASSGGINSAANHGKLPVLDSSLGGILNSSSTTNEINNQNTVGNGQSSAGGSGNLLGTSSSYSGNNQLDESIPGQDNQANACSTYPDQDALSEISVQNEDDVMYQVASSQVASAGRSGNQSSSDYPYNHYVPTIEQTFSPRPMTKMMASHMTILPSMLSSQAFFQEQGQFPIDAAYYVSQPGQFYASNYMQQQDQGTRADYSGDQNTSAQSYNNPGYTVNESERQRLDNYHTNTTNSYPQHSSSNANYNTSMDYNDTNTVYNDINDLHVGTNVDRELQHIHNNAYMNQNLSLKSSSSQMLPSDGKPYMRINRYNDVKADANKQQSEQTSSNSQRYLNISPVSCQETTNNDQPFIEAISPYNPDTEITIPNQNNQIPSMMKESGNSCANTSTISSTNVAFTNPVSSNYTITNSSSSAIHSSDKTVSASNITGNGGNSLSSSHFSSRPAARMPPKKAGYRGIESDYNRHFNIFVDQYSKPDNMNSSHNSNNKSFNEYNKSQATEQAQKMVKHDSSLSSQNVQSESSGNQNSGSYGSIVVENSQIATSEVHPVANTSSVVTQPNTTIKAERSLKAEKEQNNPYSKVQNISTEMISVGNNLKQSQSGDDSANSILHNGNHNYTTNVQPSDNQCYPQHNIHIQTKKMAASQAAKAAIQASAAAAASASTNNNSIRNNSLTQSSNNMNHDDRQNSVSQPELNKNSSLANYTITQPQPPQQQQNVHISTGEPAIVNDNQLQRQQVTLDHSTLYNSDSEQNICDASIINKSGSTGGLTPTKNSNMADLVDSYIEDYLRFIDHSNEHPSPTKSSSFQQLGVCSNSGSNNSSQSTSVTSQQFNTSNLQAGMNSAYVSQDIGIPSGGSITTGIANNLNSNYSLSSANQNTSGQNQETGNNSVNGVNSVSYSVEDVRKTILNVLSQECFDDDSGLSSNSKEQSSSSSLSTFKKQDSLPLTTLLKMVPFDKSKPLDASMPGPLSSTNLTQYADVSSSQENVDRLMMNQAAAVAGTSHNDEEDEIVRHFEDIDSGSDDGSDYNLVIDFDKEIHEEDDDEVDYRDGSAIKDEFTNRSVTSFCKSSNGKFYKGKLASKLRTLNMLENPCEKETSNISSETKDVGIKDISDVKLKGENSMLGSAEKKGSSKRKRQPIKIPKYTLTAEYREDNDARLGHRSSHKKSDEPHIVKPLKKRIKLKLLMKKLQEEDVTVTRHMLKKKIPSRRIKYSCELCQREFWDKYKAFAEHMQHHGLNELSFCNVCGMGYRRLEDLSKHRATNHSLNSFQCKDCVILFDNAVTYKKHCVTDHGNMRPFYCMYEGCTYSCERFNTLEKHTLIHGEEKQFTCPHCSTQFSQPNGLRAHLVSCMNMQTYVCHLCGKAFNRNQGLKEHLLCHSGVKKHVCKDCNASFNDVRNYKRHCRTHSNELKFACRHCDSKFNYSHVLKRHILKKHPDKEHVEFGKKGAKNKDSVLIKNYID